MAGVLSRLVAEYNGQSSVDVGTFELYELSLELEVARLAAAARHLRHNRTVRILGASRCDSWNDTVEQVLKAPAAGLDAVVFEALHTSKVNALVARLSAEGVLAVPTVHLGPASDPARILDELEWLECSGGWISKVAYEVTTPAAVAAGLRVLDEGVSTGRPVSITPMGTAWGRIAAAAAGSALIFAPLDSSDPARLSADRAMAILDELRIRA
jgi:hypothetical protein